MDGYYAFVVYANGKYLTTIDMGDISPENITSFNNNVCANLHTCGYNNVKTCLKHTDYD